MKRISAIGCLAAALAVTVGAAHGATISQWNFNSPVPDANTDTGSTSPSTGSGTASLAGGVTAAANFGSGDVNGGSSDPASGDDSGWQTTTYPAQGAGDLTGGVQFAVSTVGYKNITLSYDLRHSNTSSRYEALQYSTNGGASFSTANFFTGASGDTWFNVRSGDLSAISAVNNNANFVFRIVTAFEAAATGAGANSYVASNTGSNYAASGTWRFDMVTVIGDLVPEPGSLALVALGGLVFALRARRS